MTYVPIPLFPPETSWRPPAVSTLPSWAGAWRVAIDVETRDPTLTTLGPGVRRGAEIVGISFAIEDGPAAYLPLAHAGGDNLDREHVLAYLRDQAAHFRGELAGANLGYDLDFLEQAGVKFAPSWYRDVQVAEPLLDEHQFNYSLEHIAQRYGLAGKEESLLRLAARRHALHHKDELWKLPARYVGGYAEQDARLPLDLLRLQEERLRAEKLEGIWDMESRVLPILVKMRRWGVRIDLKRLDEVEAWVIAEEDKALREVASRSGITLSYRDLGLPEALLTVIEPLGLGIAIPRTEKTGKPSFKKDWLAKIDHPIAKALGRAKRMDKIRRDFVRSIREHLVGDRIHCTFNQLKSTRDDGDAMGTVTGRLSSADPNLQQQPARDPELGPMWRSIYIPDEGMLWASGDYSAQEPRMAVHYAAVAGCPGAAEMVATYRKDPNTDLHMATADLCFPDWPDRKKARKNAKEIFLGLAYGMGGAKLCRKLGLPTAWQYSKKLGRDVEVAGPEGQAIIDRYHAMVPFLKELSLRAQTRVRLVGYVRTLGGRRCRFQKDPRKLAEGIVEYMRVNKALNSIIQGSSADQTKLGMIALDSAGLCPQLQIHDEVCRSVRSEAEGREMAHIMEHAVELRVPSVCDIKVVPNWGAAKG